MTCNEVRALFSEVLDGAVPDPGPVEGHLRTCAACQRELETFRKAIQYLQNHGMVQASGHFTEDVLHAVDRLEEETALADLAAESPKDRSRFPDVHAIWSRLRPYAAMAAGVVAVAVAGYAVFGIVLSSPKDRVDAPRPAGPTASAPSTEELMKSYGFVYRNGKWVNPEVAEGKVYIDEEWITPAEAALRLQKKEQGTPPEPFRIARPPDPAAPPVTGGTQKTEDVMRQSGMVLHEGRWVPQDYVEQLRLGKVLFEGRWVTREELKRLLNPEDPMAERRVEKQNPAEAATNEVTRSVEGLLVGAPVRVRQVTLYPISSPAVREGRKILLLETALAGNDAEVSETESVSRVMVKNKSDRELTLFGGEILVGGEFDRMVAADTVVPPHDSRSVPVFCVEPGRSGGEKKFVKDSGKHMAPAELILMVQSGAGQTAVWLKVARYLDSMKVRNGTRSLAAALSDSTVARVREEYRKGFQGFLNREKNMVGVAVAVRDQLSYVELSRDPAMFERIFTRVVDAAAMTAEYGEPPASPLVFKDTMIGVKEFLQLAFYCRYAPAESQPGVMAIVQGSETIGAAAVYDGTLMHAMLSPSAVRPSREDWKKTKVKLPAAKDEKFVKQYMSVLKSADPSARISALQELSSIVSPRAIQAIIPVLGDPDPEVAATAAAALASYNDHSLTATLIDSLLKNRQNGRVVHGIVRVLAETGDDRAVEPFLTLIRGNSAAEARLILENLPKLLVQSQNPKSTDRVVTTLIDLWELSRYRSSGGQVPRGTPGWIAQESPSSVQTAIQDTLKSVLGMEFGTPSEYRTWWNKNKPK